MGRARNTTTVESAELSATVKPTAMTSAEYVSSQQTMTQAEADSLARFEKRTYTFKRSDISGNLTTFKIPLSGESLSFADVVCDVKAHGVKYSTTVVADAEFGAEKGEAKVPGSIEPGTDAVRAFLRRAGLAKIVK